MLPVQPSAKLSLGEKLENERKYGTGVEHEFMVQSRGGHSSVVMATLEHSKKYVFQADVEVATRNQVAKHLKLGLLHAPARYHQTVQYSGALLLSSSNYHPAF